MTNIASIDNGNGFLKAVVNNKKIKFANVTGNYRPSEVGSDDNLSIKIDGVGAWNFGNTAILQSDGGGNRRQSSARYFTPEYLAGLLLAISEGYSSNTRDIEVDVYTGLPGSEYNQYSNPDDKSYQAKFKKFIQGDYDIQRPGYKQHIRIKSIKATHQAWGAIYGQLIDAQGNSIKPDIKAKVLQIGSVNIGYYTVEVGTVEVRGLKVTEAKGKSKSEAKGAHTITDSLVNDLYRKFGSTFSTERAVSIMENGGLILDGFWQDYVLSDEIKNAFGQNVLSLSKQVWNDDEIRSLYKIILTGGGANVLNGVFNQPQLSISNSPQWDTVEGYQRLAKLISKRSK